MSSANSYHRGPAVRQTGNVAAIAAAPRPLITALLCLMASSMLVACGGTTSPQQSLQPAGLSCVDDSNHCITQREKVFDSYMADKSRGWVKQPANARAYASGVRLFAMSKRRRDLTCDELRHGKSEADGASGVLRGSGGARLTPAQVSRGIMLAQEVSVVLGREYQRRCGKA